MLSRLGGMLFSIKEHSKEPSKCKDGPEDRAAALRRSTRDLRKLVNFNFRGLLRTSSAAMSGRSQLASFEKSLAYVRNANPTLGAGQ